MQLRSPLQYLQEYLDNNSDKREIYVNWGLVAAKLAVVPVNKLLKHLIEVQHLDPNGMPAFEIIKKALDIRHTKSYDEDFDNARFADMHQKIHPTSPVVPPQEEFPRFEDDSAFELDPMDRLQNVLDRLNNKLGTDEEYKPTLDVFIEAAENNRDALSMEEVKKLVDRTEELKKAKEIISKGHEGDVEPAKPRPTGVKKVGKAVRATESPITLSEATILTEEMLIRGLCGHDADSINANIDEVMKWTREAFESLKRVVLRKAAIKSTDLPLKKKKGRILKQVAKSGKKKPDFNSPLPRTSRR